MHISTVTPQDIKDMVSSLEQLLREDNIPFAALACDQTLSGYGLLAWGSEPDSEVPDEEQLERLVFTYRILQAVANQCGDQYARMWFMECLGPGCLPVYDLIRVGNYQDVREMARECGVTTSI